MLCFVLFTRYFRLVVIYLESHTFLLSYCSLGTKLMWKETVPGASPGLSRVLKVTPSRLQSLRGDIRTCFREHFICTVFSYGFCRKII